MYDWLIVGAGFSGATLAERLATELNHRVLIIDRRNHIGGNAYDEYDENGVLVHRYGPHIFHTNAGRISHYLSRFTSWAPCRHEVLGMVDGTLVPIPFNLVSIARLFSQATAERLEQALLSRFEYGCRVPIGKLRETGEKDLIFLADYVRDQVFTGYNRKQWGISADQMIGDPSSRVPIKISHDGRYYQDKFEALPVNGYTAMFRRMLDHPNIHVMLNTDFRDVANVIPFGRMVYTGAIDSFFDYAHGRLDSRSLRFEFAHASDGCGLANSQINYPNQHDYFRATDFSRLVPQTSPNTSILHEYPEHFEEGKNERFYYVPSEDCREMHRRYAEEAKSLAGRVYFAGWMTSFQYYNMDQAVARALTVFDRISAAPSGDGAQVSLNREPVLAASVRSAEHISLPA